MHPSGNRRLNLGAPVRQPKVKFGGPGPMHPGPGVRGGTPAKINQNPKMTGAVIKIQK